MHSGLRKGLGGGHILVEDVPQVLDYFCDDSRAAGGGMRKVDGAVGKLNNSGGD